MHPTLFHGSKHVEDQQPHPCATAPRCCLHSGDWNRNRRGSPAMLCMLSVAALVPAAFVVRGLPGAVRTNLPVSVPGSPVTVRAHKNEACFA
jgi:hypothetical protein